MRVATLLGVAALLAAFWLGLAESRTLQQMGGQGTFIKEECIPRCKKGQWYTLGIPVVNCAHEEETEWLVKMICKKDVSVSQLLPLLPEPDKCSLSDMSTWLQDTCHFPLSQYIPDECKPRCTAPRWHSFGIPIQDCTEMEYEAWLSTRICDIDDPISVRDLVDLSWNPDKCGLNDLDLWLRDVCADVPGFGANVVAMSGGRDEGWNGPSITGREGGAPVTDADASRFTSLKSESDGAVSGQIEIKNKEGFKTTGSTGSGPMSQGLSRPPMPQGGLPQFQGGMNPAAVAGQRCSQSPDPGPCRSAIQAYYFDTSTRTCKPFIYGGCSGNENRFNTFNECMQSCDISRPGAAGAALKPLKLLFKSCGAAEAASMGNSAQAYMPKTPVVLDIADGTPGSQVAIFRSPYTAQDDPRSMAAVPQNIRCANTPLGLGGSFQTNQSAQIKAWSVDLQAGGDAVFKIDDDESYSPSVCRDYVYQAIDLTSCQLSNVLDTRRNVG